MNPDELRAAAERCRELLHDRKAFVDWDEASIQCIRDLALLAHAYLAANPADDGEPVTIDWLLSLGGQGGESPAETRYVDFIMIRDGSWFLFLRIHDPADDDDGICLTDVFRNSGTGMGLPTTNVTTRGHVRRLAAALGVALKEQP